MQFDPESFGKAMGEAIRRAVDPLHDHIKRIEERVAELSGKEEPAPPVEAEDLKPLVERSVSEFLTELDQKILSHVEKAVASIPAPKDGKDGKSMMDFMINREGELVGTYSDGTHKNFGVVVGRDGKDGISLESFVMEYDSEAREVVHKASAAGRTQELRFYVGGFEAKGYWREGKKAQAGDGWTHDGSFWIAKRETDTTPSAKSEDWMLAARRGRDGENVIKRVNTGPVNPIKLDDDDASHD